MNQDTGLFDTISEDYILAKCKMRLRLNDTTSQDAFLLDMINEAVNASRNCFTLIPAIARLPIDPVTFAAQVPKGFQRLAGENPIQIIDPNIRIVTSGNSAVPSTVSPFATASGFYKGDLAYKFTAKVVDGYIYFGSSVTQSMCQISYISTNIDSAGNLKIPALAERPFTAYGIAEYYDSIDDPRAEKWEQRWCRGKRWMKGVFADPDSLERELIGLINNNFISFQQYYGWWGS